MATARLTLVTVAMLIAAALTLALRSDATRGAGLYLAPADTHVPALTCDTLAPLSAPDGDGIASGFELSIGSDPCDPDSDHDYCMDGNEIWSDPNFGGDRVPLAQDFYDVDGNAVIDMDDSVKILGAFGAAPDAPGADVLDRYIPDPSKPWRVAPANDGVDLVDVLASLRSFGADCTQSTLNPQCPGLMSGVQVGPLSTGTTGPVTVLNVIEVGGEPKYVDWISTVGIDFVYVKSSTTYLTYTYNPETFHGEGLSGPPGADGPSGISLALFCYGTAGGTPVPPTTTPQTRTPVNTSVPQTQTPTRTPTRTPTNTPVPSSTPTRTPTNTPALPSITPTATPTRTGTPAACEPAPDPTPARNGLVKSIDCQLPAGDTMLVNLWLCADQATDHLDNNGDSTVDNEPPTCTRNGEGSLHVDERIYSLPDCDTRNDDDDGDGKPVSNDPASPGYRPECPAPTGQDYVQDLVDKDGGELPEGLGAFEFQIKFDHKIFDITAMGDTEWANGRSINCSMTVITENDIRFGCISTGTQLGLPQARGEIGARLWIYPEPDLRYRLRPAKDNQITRRILDENCEISDIYGDLFPGTLAGLTPDCTDLDITVRRLEGDVDMDCDVDATDQALMNWRFPSFFGSAYYDPLYDLEPWPNGDYDIDIKDLQFVNGRFGSTCAYPIPNNQNPLQATGVGVP